jgi:hypothetical protein
MRVIPDPKKTANFTKDQKEVALTSAMIRPEHVEQRGETADT